MSLARRTAPIIGAVTLALTAACRGDPTSSLDGPPLLARIAQAELNRAGDSLRLAGADPARWQGYYALARFAVTAGPVTPITIDVDGVSEEYAAVAVQMGRGSPCSLDPGALCATTFSGGTSLSVAPLRMLIAWRRNDPRRVVQLTATLPDGPITGPSIYPGEPFAGAATLTFLDGVGGYYSASTGTAALDVRSASDSPCYRPSDLNLPVVDIQTADVGACTLAELQAGFSATVVRPQIGGPRENSASGTHTVQLRVRSLRGAIFALSPYLCMECSLGEFPTGARPPLDPRSQMLTATLTAQIGSAVTLTFTVKNPTAAPVTIDRATAQRYDFAIASVQTNSVIWRWSADKLFAQTLGSETLAPGTSVTYVEQWTPTVHGYFLATAHLVSVDQRVMAVTSIQLP